MSTLINSRKTIKISLVLMVPVIILLFSDQIPFLQNLTTVQVRVTAIFFLAAALWISEVIPIFTTSILVITLELLLLSDSGVKWLVTPEEQNFGQLFTHKEIMATFASPVILLFLGGFFLALAATKYRLDHNIAGVVLRYFGTNPKWVLLGLMMVSGVFSMFMSNTATTAMMLAIILPVLQVFPGDDPARTGFVLGIPFAANLGGMGTPIGTPPNAIALKFLTDTHLNFGKWMAFGVPLVLVMLFVTWYLLILLFPPKQKTVQLNFKVDFLKTRKAILVYILFIITILLWLTDFIHGMNSYVVAMIPVATFLVFGIINKEDLKQISWDVLWLVSGGIAIGLALDKSGLATAVIQQIPLQNASPYLIITLCMLTGLAMSNFMSHTATANLLLPIFYSIGTAVPSMGITGGSGTLILGTTMAISLGMSLPISSPPNALASSTGKITTRDMAKTGALIGIIGSFMVMGIIYLLNLTGFLQ